MPVTQNVYGADRAPIRLARWAVDSLPVICERDAIRRQLDDMNVLHPDVFPGLGLTVHRHRPRLADKTHWLDNRESVVGHRLVEEPLIPRFFPEATLQIDDLFHYVCHGSWTGRVAS